MSVLGRQASNNQFARYFYYIGRIKTIQLEYTEALNYLQEALRKAPQSGVVGFRITVNKCIAIVQLLMILVHGCGAVRLVLLRVWQRWQRRR